MTQMNNRIMIVDDEDTNRKILKIWLEEEYEIMEASSGEEALEEVDDYKPALILLDIMMGGIDGYEVTKKIRSNEKHKNIRIILLTGKVSLEEKLEGYRSGTDDYLSKPFEVEELKAKIVVFMNLFNMEQELLSINNTLEKVIEERTKQLLHGEKMAYIGKITAEIVHNLKTPISVLLGQVYFLRKSKFDEKKADIMESCIEKINDITSSILRSARESKQSDDFRVDLNLNDIITEEVDLLKFEPYVKNNIVIKTNLSDITTIRGEKVHFAQIFSNLLSNAKEALLNNDDDKMIEIKSIQEDKKIILSFTDNGHGIPKEIQHKIFESLFTTKSKENNENQVEEIEGTGLGLDFTKKMIESYNGKITFKSIAGKGTTFTIVLPI